MLNTNNVFLRRTRREMLKLMIFVNQAIAGKFTINFVPSL